MKEVVKRDTGFKFETSFGFTMRTGRLWEVELNLENGMKGFTSRGWSDREIG
jgi:hypothetical protein